MLEIFPENYNKKSSLDSLKRTKVNNKKTKSSSSSNINKSFFKGVINESIDVTNYNEDIDNFIEELDTLQADLVLNPSLELVENYRGRVGAFLKHLLANYQSSSFYRGIKTRIELKIWHMLDSEMDKLGKSVVSGHLEGFSVLSRLNMVKGLIIDLKVGK